MDENGAHKNNACLEVSDQDFFGKEKVSEDGGVKRLEDALVDEAKVRVTPLNHRRVSWRL